MAAASLSALDWHGLAIPRRILLVEGDQRRTDRLVGLADTWCDHTGDPEEAIRWLEQRAYTDLWLNHDLGCEPLNGRTVSLWLCAHPLAQPWLRTRVHSANEVSAPKIVRELTAAGRPAVWTRYHAIVEAAQQAVQKALGNGG